MSAKEEIMRNIFVRLHVKCGGVDVDVKVFEREDMMTYRNLTLMR